MEEQVQQETIKMEVMREQQSRLKVIGAVISVGGLVGRVAHAKSSDPATPSKFETCTCFSLFFSFLLLRLYSASLLPVSTFFGFFVVTCCGSFVVTCCTCCGSFVTRCCSAILFTVTLFSACELFQTVNHISAQSGSNSKPET